MRAGTCAYCKGNVRPLAMVKFVAFGHQASALLNTTRGAAGTRGVSVSGLRGELLILISFVITINQVINITPHHHQHYPCHHPHHHHGG